MCFEGAAVPARQNARDLSSDSSEQCAKADVHWGIASAARVRQQDAVVWESQHKTRGFATCNLKGKP